MDLNTTWFIIVGILFGGYVILDGFDLGVGALHLFTKTDEHRRLMLNAIGPVWDGNEVWLVTGGGALFAAFPEVYATVFSGFYEVFMLLLFALIFRAVAIEFRSKEPWPKWRKAWDYCFAGGSILSSFLIGLAIGNAAYGIPLDLDLEYVGTLGDLFNPYAIFVGVFTVALFMMHALIFVIMKTDGEMNKLARSWVRPCIAFFLLCFFVFNVITFHYCEHIIDAVLERPYIWFIFFAALLAVLNVPRAIFHGKEKRAFASSCFAMILLICMFGLSVFPNMLFADPDVHNMDIYNSASSQNTLHIMLIIAIIGMPIVLAYTISIYWIFRGKVKITEESY